MHFPEQSAGRGFKSRPRLHLLASLHRISTPTELGNIAQQLPRHFCKRFRKVFLRDVAVNIQRGLGAGVA